MLVKMKDVTVVGGGPVGCHVGKRLADRGYDVTILEEDPEIGNPMCCAGILGAKALKEDVGMDPADWQLNVLEAGKFHGPGDNSLGLSRNRTEAYVIDRPKFDRDIAESALRSGADIMLNSRCRGVSRHAEGVTVRIASGTGSRKLESRMVIGADGPNSFVARSFDMLGNPSPIVCAQAEVVSEAEEHVTHVYLRNDLSDDFFGWVTPAGEVYRVGLGDTSGNVVERLLDFIGNNGVLPENSTERVVRLTTGTIPEPGSRDIFDERVLLVGDAAGQVKPLTGGGLYFGLSCAELASSVAVKALEDEPTEEELAEYRNLVDEKIGSELKYGKKIRRLYRRMSDEDISEFLDFMAGPEVKKLVLENAEFDRHSELLKALIKKGPSLLKSMGTRNALKYLSWLVD